MEKPKKRSFLPLAGIMVLLLGLLATTALAQTATPEAETPAQEAPDSSTEDTVPFGKFGRGRFGHFGGDAGRDENLAEALGITVEELQAARDQVFAASIAEAVADGLITQEQADEILALHRLRSTIDKQALLAEALGLTVEELEAALADGQSLSDLIAAQGLTTDTLQANLQAAYEAAVARAVADGVITQAQADEILSAEVGFGLFGGHGGPGGHGGRGHHGRGGFGPWGGESDDLNPDETTPDTSETAFDA